MDADGTQMDFQNDGADEGSSDDSGKDKQAQNNLKQDEFERIDSRGKKMKLRKT